MSHYVDNITHGQARMSRCCIDIDAQGLDGNFSRAPSVMDNTFYAALSAIPLSLLFVDARRAPRSSFHDATFQRFKDLAQLPHAFLSTALIIKRIATAFHAHDTRTIEASPPARFS